MFRTIEDFINQWSYESEATVKVLKNLTDDSLRQKVTAEGRSLGTLAWHLVTTPCEMLQRTGLKPEGPDEHAPAPPKATEIIRQYEQTALSVKTEVEKKWKDATLTETVDMYGEPWTIGFVLYSLILHQTHHRAQMTVLMRQAGLAVPGVYGPAREEWKQFGMEPQV